MNKVTLPVKAISYCASTYSVIDHQNSFEFWIRGHLIRVIGDKPFSRGDMIWIDSIEYSQTDDTYYIMIRVIDDQPYEQNLPVLNISVSRMIYSVNDFEINDEGDITLLKTIYISTDNSYSVVFISLLGGPARLSCHSPSMGASFSLDYSLDWQN